MISSVSNLLMEWLAGLRSPSSPSVRLSILIYRRVGLADDLFSTWDVTAGTKLEITPRRECLEFSASARQWAK